MKASVEKNRISASDKRQYKYFLLFSGIALLGFLLFYLYPIVRTLVLSFTDKGYGVEYDFVGLENYITALTKDELFFQSIIKSLIFALFSGFFVLVTSFVLALLLNSKVKGIGVFRTIYFLPFIIPSFAVGAVYKNIFNPDGGIINGILTLLGVAEEDLPLWYAGPDTALTTMIIISSFGFGVKMLVFLAALQNIPKHYYEVAELEGMSKLGQLFKITLPMISPMTFFNIILITIDGLKAFSLAFVMGNGQGWPSNSTLLFPIYMFTTAFSDFKMGYAAAMAWLFFILILTLTGIHFLVSRFYVEKDLN